MRHWVPVCRERSVAMVIGTTGLMPDDHKLIDAAAADIAVLQAPNMSVGVNLLFRIAAEVARTLGQEYDIEIVEAHHRFKKDAPSGTAIGLADAIKKATQREIPMHSLRIGDEVGKHTAYFAALGERLELTHVATNRDTFALGALRAAKWLASQKRGRYGMEDVLGFGQ
jgi:4-hydroxy-tetrahydrodipicolinate reductase